MSRWPALGVFPDRDLAVLTTGIVSALDREIDSVNQRTIRGVVRSDE